MDKIRVKRLELLAKVKENRSKHRAIFEAAVKGYREQAIAELDAILSEARAGKRIRRGVNLIEPMDQTKEYDKAIIALEMSADEIIELDDREFACLVMDDWVWKGQFAASTQAYSNLSGL